MKEITTHIPSIQPWRGLVAWPTAAALVMWVAALPPFLNPIYPVAPPMFTVCLYIALASLAAFVVPTSRGFRIAMWTPTIAHLVLVSFAAFSFVCRSHWPWYSNPDPSELRVPLFYGAAVFAVLAGAISIPVGAFVLIASVCGVRRDELSQRARGVLHGAAVLGLGTWLWVFEWTDQRLFNWLAD